MTSRCRLMQGPLTAQGGLLQGIGQHLQEILSGNVTGAQALMDDLASELAARTIRQVGPQPLAAEMGMAGVPLVSQRITSFHLCQQEFRR